MSKYIIGTLYFGYIIITILYLPYKKALFEKVLKITPDKYILKSIFEALFLTLLVWILPMIINIGGVQQHGLSYLWPLLIFTTPLAITLFLISFLTAKSINKNNLKATMFLKTTEPIGDTQINNINYNIKKTIKKRFLTPILFLMASIILFIPTYLASRHCTELICIIFFYPLGLAGILFLLFLIFLGLRTIEYLEYKKWNENERLIKIITHVSKSIIILTIIVYSLSILLLLISPSFYWDLNRGETFTLIILTFLILILFFSSRYLSKKLKSKLIIRSKLKTLMIKNIVALFFLFLGCYALLNTTRGVCEIPMLEKNEQQIINICKINPFCELKNLTISLDNFSSHSGYYCTNKN